MRAWIAVCAVATVLIAAPAARAAPTCLDLQGRTVRCENPDAMPVGWTPSPEQRREWNLAHPGPSQTQLLEVFLAILAFFGVLALMPDFDDRWDRQENDDEDRR